jgi:hypothetical protein
MNKLLPTLIGFACLSLTLPAVASEAEEIWNMTMAQKMDDNKDGMISKAEFQKHSTNMKKWQEMDKNKDGMLDADEIRGGFNEK